MEVIQIYVVIESPFLPIEDGGGQVPILEIVSPIGGISIGGELGGGQLNGIGEEQLHGIPRPEGLVELHGYEIPVSNPFPVQSGIVLVDNGLDQGISPFPILGQ